MSEFDPYLKWLGIRKDSPVVDHYTLLGIAQFEDDQEVISTAADRQMVHVRTFQTGERGVIAQKILNELARARRCLLTPDKKAAYDEQLKANLAQSASVPTTVVQQQPPQIQTTGPDSNAGPIPPVITPGATPSGAPALPQGRVIHDVDNSPEFGAVVEMGSGARPRSRSKKDSGTLWTIIGALGGGISALAASYFILTSMGIWDGKEVATNDNDRQTTNDTTNDSDDPDTRDDNNGPLVDKKKDNPDSNKTDNQNPRNNNNSEQEPNDPFQGNNSTSSNGGSDSSNNSDSDRAQRELERHLQREITTRKKRYEKIANRREQPTDDDQVKMDQLKFELEQLQLEYHKVATGNNSTPDPDIMSSPEVASQNPKDDSKGNDSENPSDLLSTSSKIISSVSKAAINPTIDLTAKEALPAVSLLKEAESKIKEAFSDELKEAKSSDVKALEMGRRFLKDARSNSNNPAEQFAFYEMSIELAKEVGDGKTAANALLEMDAKYIVDDFWRDVHKTIDPVSKKIQELPQAQEFYVSLDDLAKRAIVYEQAGELDYLFAKGLSVAKKMKNESAKDYYVNARELVNGIETLIESNKAAELKLASSPNDPTSNLSHGDYLAYFQGDLAGAIEYWEKSNDAVVSKLVEKELALEESDSLKATTDAAEAWFEMGVAYQGYANHVQLLRARDLYERVESETKGLTRQKAAQKIDEINSTLKRVFLAADSISLFSSKINVNIPVNFVSDDEATQERFRRGLTLEFRRDNNVRASFANIGEVVPYMETEPDTFVLDGKQRQFAILLDTSETPFRVRLEIYDRRMTRVQETHFFTLEE